MVRSDLVQHAVPALLGTRKMIAECRKLMGPDEYGRRLPDYAIIGQALQELRDRLQADAKKGKKR